MIQCSTISIRGEINPSETQNRDTDIYFDCYFPPQLSRFLSCIIQCRSMFSHPRLGIKLKIASGTLKKFRLTSRANESLAFFSPRGIRDELKLRFFRERRKQNREINRCSRCLKETLRMSYINDSSDVSFIDDKIANLLKHRFQQEIFIG